MIVGIEHRGQGIATKILKTLRYKCQTRRLKAICSTEKDNKVAQKDIENAGFSCKHKIFQIIF
jgi:predicted acetyltransferase